LKAPSVVIVGDKDALIPPDRSSEIADGAPRSRLVVLQGVAHMSAMEAPREVARELMAPSVGPE
jgi:3-oxoadipate enol-lactonase/4-carboxymuconolactone decarboxylase